MKHHLTAKYDMKALKMFTEVRARRARRRSLTLRCPSVTRVLPAVVSQADEKFRVDLCGILGTDDDGLDDMVKNGAGDEFDLQEVWQAGGAEALVRLARCRPPRRARLARPVPRAAARAAPAFSPALSASSAARAEPAMPRGPRARAQTGWFVSCPNAKVQESLEAIRKVIGVIVLPDADAKEAK